jgi:Fe-S-cluster-containing dehydrogenase component
MKKWNLIIDVATCTNCRNCTLAAKDEYVDNEWPSYCAAMPRRGHRWFDILTKERGQAPMLDVAFLPVACNHCDNAPCIKAAQGGAIRKREDGIILIDPDKAVGQKHLVDACPYGQIWWNEERQIPQNWPFDAHLLDSSWTQTRAEQSCPTGAIKTLKVEDEEMQRIAREDRLEVLRPELDTKPRLYYRNLNRYTKCFIGGSVSTAANGGVECVANARVMLHQHGATIAETTTDNYGEFKFDGLNEYSGPYLVEVVGPGGSKRELEVNLALSVNLGDIRL